MPAAATGAVIKLNIFCAYASPCVPYTLSPVKTTKSGRSCCSSRLMKRVVLCASHGHRISSVVRSLHLSCSRPICTSEICKILSVFDSGNARFLRRYSRCLALDVRRRSARKKNAFKIANATIKTTTTTRCLFHRSTQG